MKHIPTLVLLVGLLVLAGCEAQVDPVQPPNVLPTAPALQVQGVPAQQLVLADNLLADNYLLLLDNSGSMNGAECSGGKAKFDVAKEAIANFVNSLPDGANVGLVVFAGARARVVTTLGNGPAHKVELVRGMPKSAKEGTPLKQSLKDMEEFMTAQAVRQLWYGTFKLVIVTDGVSTDGDPGPLAKEIVLKKPFEIHAIGFCIGESHSLAVQGYTRYYSAMDPTSLRKALEGVRAETDKYDGGTL